MKKRIFLFPLILFLLTVQPLRAGQVDCCLSQVSINCASMRITICPMGDFEHFDTACGAAGGRIKIEAKDAANNPVPGVPRTDYWLNACDPAQELCLCCQPVIADAETDVFGTAYICGPVSGGGCILNGGVYVMIQGQVIVDFPGCMQPTCLDIVVVSPDLSADCVVNLTDLAMFAWSYNTSPAADPCCDFNDDTICNLSDFALFGEHYIHSCR